MNDRFYADYVQQQYTVSVMILSVLAIVFQPAFHYVLQLIPNIPPDSLTLRLVSVGVSAILLLAVLLYKPSRRYSPVLQVLNAGTALIVVHLLVLNSANHPMYLAASLTAVYGAQLAFVRLRDWLITAGLVFGLYLGVSLLRGAFGTREDLLPLFFYTSNYIITTGLVFGRDRLLRDDFRTRSELQFKNAELGVITERLQNDLVLARDIQQSLLPPASPGWQHLDLVCYSQPAREVGGDFYTYHTFGDGRIALAVGDVSGKGVSAALLMSTSISLFNASLGRKLPPAQRMARLDTQIMPYTQSRSLNCALCYVELDGERLTIVNAAGVPPYLRRSSGTVEWPDAWGFALGQGLGAERGYQAIHQQVRRGDMIILVSDGMVEARDARGTMWGFDRLEQAIKVGPSTSAQAMIDHLLRRLRKFVGKVEPHDDLTIAVLRIC
jgi:serine phosphatase RsbU (regulator of sigma subunit)